MSLDNLPVEWSKEQLGLIVNFIDYRGKTPTKTSEGIPLITAKNIRDGYINRKPREYIAEDAYDDWMTRGIPQLGDLVITTEAPMGNVAILNIQEKFALAQRAICLNFKYNKNISKFLYYYLRSQNFKADLQKKATGTTVQGIKAAELKKIFVPLVPLAEQQEIVRQLDVMLAQVEQIKARLEVITVIIRKTRQSIINFSIEHIENEALVELKNLIIDCNVGLVKSSKEQFSESKELIPYFKMNNIDNEWGYNLDKLVYVDFIEEDLCKYLLQKDDWLFNTRNSYELVGKSCIWKEAESSYFFNNNILKVRFNKNLVLPEFIEIFFKSSVGKNKLNAIKSGTTNVAAIYQKQLFSLQLPVPSIEIQSKIIKEINERFVLISRINDLISLAQKRVNLLTQSVLAKAFSGELTAEWREQHQTLITGINSAESLLAKIQAEREASKLVKKAKKVK